MKIYYAVLFTVILIISLLAKFIALLFYEDRSIVQSGIKLFLYFIFTIGFIFYPFYPYDKSYSFQMIIKLFSVFTTIIIFSDIAKGNYISQYIYNNVYSFLFPAVFFLSIFLQHAILSYLLLDRLKVDNSAVELASFFIVMQIFTYRLMKTPGIAMIIPVKMLAYILPTIVLLWYVFLLENNNTWYLSIVKLFVSIIALGKIFDLNKNILEEEPFYFIIKTSLCVVLAIILGELLPRLMVSQNKA
jgi:hypothetical protein